MLFPSLEATNLYKPRLVQFGKQCDLPSPDPFVTGKVHTSHEGTFQAMFDVRALAPSAALFGRRKSAAVWFLVMMMTSFDPDLCLLSSPKL